MSVNTNIKNRTVKRGGIVLVAFLLCAIILLINILRISVIGHETYKEKAYDQITTSSFLKAERGNIYDANMNALATVKTSWRIFTSPKAIYNHKRDSGEDLAPLIAKGMSEIFGGSYESLLKKISNARVLDVTIEKSASEDEYKKVTSFITSNSLEHYLATEAQSIRQYPSETLAAHVLGFTGSDSQGLYGLEYSYNSILTGKDGFYLYAKDANGNPMPGSYSTLTPAVAGNSIVTTIDSYIQSELEAQLSEILKTHMVTDRVCGIVMDTKTGAILAMATSSPFNPNTPYELDEISEEKLRQSGYSEGSDEYKALKTELMQKMWSNKAVSETYEPGSTFKIVTVSAALDSGSAKITDKFSCRGYHTIGGWRIKCHKTTGHGSGFDLGYGLQMSCNPTMMEIASRTGSEVFYSYVEKFGYFEKTGIDLPSEARTIFHSPENIGPTELATASFGQRFKVSIISQLRAIAAVANGGYLVEPYLVDSILDPSGNVVSKHETVIKRRVISSEVAETISRVLEEGVSGDGGAKNAYVDGYSVAAKTGTSQKFDVLDENGNSYLRIGSTVAYAPSDESGIAVIIVVDEPQGQVKYGSTVAAPYVSSLLGKILPYLEYERKSESAVFTPSNYVGMNVNSVKKELNAQGIKYEIIGDGEVVLSQFPEPLIEVTSSLARVYIYTIEENRHNTTVPDLVGLGAAEAIALATSAGFNIKISGVTSLKGDYLRVVAQSLVPGNTHYIGDVIELTVLRTDFED